MNNLKYYTEGDTLYADIRQAICSAKHSVCIESYIFANDEIGNEIIEQLYKKVEENITVKLIIDSVGSNRFKNFKFFRKLSKKGISLKWFNPWSWRDPLKFNRRNHRKLIIIDNKICFLGGFNIHNDSSKKYCGKKRWKDSHVYFTGNLVISLRQQFDLMWCGKIRQLSTITNKDGSTTIVPNSSRKCNNHLLCKYLDLIHKAKHSIKVSTPYFVPDTKMLKALINAAKSGVEINLLIPKYSDHALLKHAAYWYYQKLIMAKINIYEFSSRMLHSKNMIIDDEIAVIGSANMDYRSFFLNNEIMLFSRQHNLLNYILQDFKTNIASAEQVSLKQATSRSTLTVISSFVAYLLRRWL